MQPPHMAQCRRSDSARARRTVSAPGKIDLTSSGIGSRASKFSSGLTTWPLHHFGECDPRSAASIARNTRSLSRPIPPPTVNQVWNRSHKDRVNSSHLHRGVDFRSYKLSRGTQTMRGGIEARRGPGINHRHCASVRRNSFFQSSIEDFIEPVGRGATP